MVTSELHKGNFFFNISADVGKNCPNKPDDVQFVRFGYHCMRNDQTVYPKLTERERNALKVMQSSGPYGPDLQEVIDAHQAKRGGTQDGKVSVGKSQIMHNVRYDHDHLWIVYSLCNSMRHAAKLPFPRIDLDPDKKIGQDLKNRVIEIFAVDPPKEQ